MDPSEIVKQLLAEGASESDIIQALQELGIEDPQKVLSDAKAKLGLKPSLKPQAPAAEEAVGKSLFGEQAPQKEEKDEMQGLQITKVSDEGEEETLDIESMLGGEKQGKEKPRPAVEPEGEQAPAAGFGEKRLKSIEGKVDELVALTKALQEINKKILETQREALLRSK